MMKNSVFLFILILVFSVFSFLLIPVKADIADIEIEIEELFDLEDAKQWDIINFKVKEKRVKEDLIYKTVNGNKLKLDIYYPLLSMDKKYPVVLFIHGGGFIMGDKNDIHRFDPLLEAMLKKGWAVISIQYRLLGKDYFFPDNLNDVQDAVQWVINNSDKYELNSEKLGLWGSSAGGNLALMAGIFQTTNPVNFIISFAGPTDLGAEELILQKRITRFFLGKDISDTLLKKASPLYYIDQEIPPVLLVHGREDMVVPYSQSKKFYEQAVKYNPDCKIISVDGGHTPSPSFLLGLDDIKDEVTGFIKRNFREEIKKNS